MYTEFKRSERKVLTGVSEIYRYGKRNIRRLVDSVKYLSHFHQMTCIQFSLGRDLLELLLKPVLRPFTIRAYLKAHEVPMLQIGDGVNILEGWLNTNEAKSSSRIIFLDATKTYPFADKTFHYVFSKHQIEHLTFHEGVCMIKECFRALKPGGKIRIATPDLDALISLQVSHKSEIRRRYINMDYGCILP